MKTNFLNNKLTFSLIAILSFLIIIFIYFQPYLAGKTLAQNDVLQSQGAQKETNDYEKIEKQEVLWSGALFSGMPVWGKYDNNYVNYFHRTINWLFPPPVAIFLLAFVGFYLLLLAFGVNQYLSTIGALAYTFSSFSFISIEAGHLNKVYDMALMAPVLAGLVWIYRGKYYAGALVTMIATACQIYYGHVQISYYLVFIILFFVVAQLIVSIKEKSLKHFFIASFIALVSAVIGIAPNVSKLWTMQEYSKSTTRGGSELQARKAEGDGLDKEYALSWSNGISEPLTIFIPGIFGGSSNEKLGTGSETYQALTSQGASKSEAKEYLKNMPLYWGDQPFTSGPIYFGAVACFLFVLGIILLKGPTKIWIVSISVLSILLSMGKNFEALTDLFFYHVPLYNKFRSVTMIMAIAQLTFPLLGILVLDKIVKKEISKEETLKGLKISLIITGGLALIFATIGGTFFDFSSPADQQLPSWLVDALKEDRASYLRTDSFRSLLIVVVTAGLIWAVITEKLKAPTFYLILGLIAILDLWIVDKRYLNADDFKPNKNLLGEIFQATPADEMILRDKDPNFRVFNVTTNPFNDAFTSYFHKSIGGYSAIKLGRYQEVIDQHISKNNMAVLNMLNTKYFIVPDQQTKQPMVQRNPGALGNAWFVDSIKVVKNADEELNALNSIDPARTAVLDEKFANEVEGFTIQKDSSASIIFKEYNPMRLVYESNAAFPQLAVFSEIYYQPGWNAYIDGKLVPHFRANYILRAMQVPAGKHEIVFKFEPKSYYQGEKIALAGSVLMILFILFFLGSLVYKNQKKTI